MKKILFICGDTSLIGGIEKYNKDFIKALKSNKKINLHVIYRKPGGFFRKLSFFINVILFVFVNKPDFIFNAHINFSLITLITKFIFKVPYSISTYGIDIIHIKSRIRKLGIKHSNIVITLSMYVENLIKKQFPDKIDKIFMLESSIDPSVLTIKNKNIKLLQKYKIPKDSKILISLARLSSNEFKGQYQILKALPNILKKIPNLFYIIAGAGYDQRVDKILLDNQFLKKNVILTGAFNEKEKSDYLNLADLYALPSKYDGFLITFIEALSCGVPVLAPNNYGCPYGLRNGKFGYLVDPENISEIEKTIVKHFEKKGPKNFYNKKFIRNESIKIYGYQQWQKKVNNLIKIISNEI